MTAFEHVMILVSFVIALALTHLLSAVIAMIRAGSRVIYAFAPLAWMAHVLITTVAWWIAYWDFRIMQVWDLGTILFNMILLILLYVLAGLVTPAIPEEGYVDLGEFHRQHFRQYTGLTVLINILSIVYSLIYGDVFHVPEQYAQVWSGTVPALLVAVVAFFFANRIVQNVCAAALFAMWPFYFYFGQHALH